MNNQTKPRKYKVRVIHDATIYGEVTVEAANSREAEEKACDLARDGKLKWELSEGNNTDNPYVNPEDIEEIG